MLGIPHTRRSHELQEKQRLIQQVLRPFLEQISDPPTKVPSSLRDSLSFIHLNLFSPRLNTAAVCRKSGIPPQRLAHRFRQSLGMSARDYIEIRRLEAAQRLLCHAQLEIYLIAMAVGYEYHETFCRAFERQVGCSPREARTRHAQTSMQSINQLDQTTLNTGAAY